MKVEIKEYIIQMIQSNKSEEYIDITNKSEEYINIIPALVPRITMKETQEFVKSHRSISPGYTD
jgi:hypothetical protein